MLTPERIEDIAARFLTDMGAWTASEPAIPEHRVKDFARALLAEVKLSDRLKEEQEFIEENKKSFVVEFSYKDECFSHVRFGSYFITLHTRTGLFYEINWIDYSQWKQKLTEQAQEVKI